MMRLLKCGENGELKLVGPFPPDSIPPYAILSHTWGSEEVTFEDLRDGTGVDKRGWLKLEFCADQARSDGFEHVWVDACCIDKANSTELQAAINSMFKWYQNAGRCYVYLSDVTGLTHETGWREAFRQSRWFTRGWTLQELLAPQSVDFFTRERNRLGSRRDLEEEIHAITKIPLSALRGDDLSKFSIDERFGWLDRRQTTLPEDMAYCLLGILGVFMPVIYGETVENAKRRLLKEAHSLQKQLAAGTLTAIRWLQIANHRHLMCNSASLPCVAEFKGTLIFVYRPWGPSEQDHSRKQRGWDGSKPTSYPAAPCWWMVKRSEPGQRKLERFPAVPAFEEGSLRPQICAFGDQLVAVWPRGPGLSFSVRSGGSLQWGRPRRMVELEYGPPFSPMMASYEKNGVARLYALWCNPGSKSEARLSWYDGDGWRLPKTLPFIKTDCPPSLACHDGKLFVAWKVSTTEKLYWMRLDADGNLVDEEPHEIGWHGESSSYPSLAEVGDTLYAAWKGKGKSRDVWIAAWRGDEKRFKPAKLVPAVDTPTPPTLAKWGNLLVIAWLNEGRILWQTGSLG